METNQTQTQEQPAQHIAPETPQAEQHPVKPLFNPAETARLVAYLTEGIFDPEYILLFGTLAGGTPHSDIAAYDLLLVVRQTPAYDWRTVKRYLRSKFPYRRREISYLNLYIVTLNHVETHKTPFLYYAHSEGCLLYCKERYDFRRPKRPCDFTTAACDAQYHFETFSTLGDSYLERAYQAQSEYNDLRTAALFTAQVVVYYYHTLYYVYHNEEFGVYDPVVMHERMRTLSSELMLILDDEHREGVYTLPALRDYLVKSRYAVHFDVDPQSLNTHMERADRMGDLIRKLCEFCIEKYRERSAQF